MVAWHLLSYNHCDTSYNYIGLHGLTLIRVINQCKNQVVLKFASVIDILTNEFISRELI